jgi:hypothetical protein
VAVLQHRTKGAVFLWHAGDVIEKDLGMKNPSDFIARYHLLRQESVLV